MTSRSLLSGISASFVQTARLNVYTLTSGPADGIPVIFLHGNVSSNRFWEETMLAMPHHYRVFAPDMRGFGKTEALAIDATRGLRDWSDDLHAFADALGIRGFHLIGWSMGGGVAMQYAIDHADHLHSITLVAPVSPYGFGGTKDIHGTVNFSDFAGSGGGAANPEFVRLLGEGDRSIWNQTSPRNVMNAFYFKPPFMTNRAEVFLSSMLSTRIGDDFYPGDMSTSPNWPTVAPGKRGVLNTMSPTYCNLSGLLHIAHKPPILWLRGADDQIVSDTSFFDFGFLGQVGAVPGWPGMKVFPPQPMIAQTRAVLDQYEANGGEYSEVVFPNCGHSPHIEKPAAFRRALIGHLANA